jgi:hypothetical protein
VVDEGFVLVGFRKPSLYLPEPDKKLCVLVGWLFASALTDAIRGTADIVYPYEEFITVRELSDEIAKRKPTVHVITAIMVLGLFEVSNHNGTCNTPARVGCGRMERLTLVPDEDDRFSGQVRTLPSIWPPSNKSSRWRAALTDSNSCQGDKQ